MKKPAFGDNGSRLLCTGLLCIATVAGCSGAQAPEGVLHGGQSDDPRSRVRAEKANIEALRLGLDGQVDTQNSPVPAGGGVTGGDAPDGGKAPVQNAGCQRTCDTGAALCTSTETICEIAKEHPTDAEFDETCQWATDACSAAAAQCVACGGDAGFAAP